MQNGQPSRTALGAAVLRAAHQTLDGASIFRDPFARIMLGSRADAMIETVAADPTQKNMRIFLAARSRFAEDSLDAAVARGVRQLVILGAGLDTFSLRNPHVALGLKIFEVDHPSTQAWKRERLREANFAVPDSLTFTPMDFSSQSLAEQLVIAGFQPAEPAFFCWLGVVPYLRREDISAIVGYIGSLPGSEVVFDYAEPLENYATASRANVMAVAARAALRGEPWLSLFAPHALHEILRDRGFGIIEDLGLAEMTERFYGTLKEGITIGPGAHVIRAQMIR
jgi:methyltransferase (TIGR00027 family)